MEEQRLSRSPQLSRRSKRGGRRPATNGERRAGTRDLRGENGDVQSEGSQDLSCQAEQIPKRKDTAQRPGRFSRLDNFYLENHKRRRKSDRPLLIDGQICLFITDGFHRVGRSGLESPGADREKSDDHGQDVSQDEVGQYDWSPKSVPLKPGLHDSIGYGPGPGRPPTGGALLPGPVHSLSQGRSSRFLDVQSRNLARRHPHHL